MTKCSLVIAKVPCWWNDICILTSRRQAWMFYKPRLTCWPRLWGNAHLPFLRRWRRESLGLLHQETLYTDKRAKRCVVSKMVYTSIKPRWIRQIWNTDLWMRQKSVAKTKRMIVGVNSLAGGVNNSYIFWSKFVNRSIRLLRICCTLFSWLDNALYIICWVLNMRHGALRVAQHSKLTIVP